LVATPKVGDGRATTPSGRGRPRDNQVSYLKWSSTESFTLGPTPKIDFKSAQQQHTTATA